eukprot:m.125247 g.125247  ORF g.125247 m.125247 type:complete len:395 (+) comp29121_c0_seq1:603-1787(+)
MYQCTLMCVTIAILTSPITVAECTPTSSLIPHTQHDHDIANTSTNGSRTRGYDHSNSSSPSTAQYLGSFAYTIPPSSAAYSRMWTADNFIVKDENGTERAWQNIILVTGNDTTFAQLSADIYDRTGQSLPMLWHWGGWLLDRHSQSVATSWQQFVTRYAQLKMQYPHLPTSPWGVYLGDEPDLARHTERQKMLADGLDTVKSQFPSTTTYLNMLYASIGCPGPNPGGPVLCKAWTGNNTALAIALGKMQLDWMSTDEYYDVSIAQYQNVYETILYPHLRPDQRVVLLPFAAYCEIDCPVNQTLVTATADAACLRKASNHFHWAQSDARVVALFIYRLKNLWQASDMRGLDVCSNPWGTGLGLVDRCGVNASSGYATPNTLKFYQETVSQHLTLT